jgi:hypothetical protein
MGIKTEELKKRIEQHRKAVFLDDDLNEAWLDYEYEQRKLGNKISFQELTENLLITKLKPFLKQIEKEKNKK